MAAVRMAASFDACMGLPRAAGDQKIGTPFMHARELPRNASIQCLFPGSPAQRELPRNLPETCPLMHCFRQPRAAGAP